MSNCHILILGKFWETSGSWHWSKISEHSICSCQAVIRQSSSSHQAVIRQSSGSHQAVIRHSSGNHQAVRKSSFTVLFQNKLYLNGRRPKHQWEPVKYGDPFFRGKLWETQRKLWKTLDKLWIFFRQIMQLSGSHQAVIRQSSDRYNFVRQLSDRYNFVRQSKKSPAQAWTVKWQSSGSRQAVVRQSEKSSFSFKIQNKLYMNGRRPNEN